MNKEELRVLLNSSFSIISYIEYRWDDLDLHYKCDYCKRSEIYKNSYPHPEFDFLMQFSHNVNCPIADATNIFRYTKEVNQ